MKQDFRILHFSELSGVERGEGIISFPLVGGDTGAQRLLTGFTILPPDASIPWHLHSSEEFILIVEGQAICEVENEKHELVKLDSTYVAAGLKHRFLNQGASPAMILWVYSDTGTTRTLAESGVILGHLERYPH